jgi:PKHD-type hydroxylase
VALRQILLRGLERSALFFSAALPKHISPPMFNRYGGSANTYGNHVDSAVRFLPDGKGRVRTDVSCTVFLAEPEEYDGGELVIEDTYGSQRVKLAAGSMVVYPGTSVHRVDPVTRGHRLASFFWIQSMVRSDEQRRLLFDMDQHLIALRQQAGEADPAIVGLTGSYHNLLRMWADV